MFQPGDIICCYGKKSFFKYFIRWCINFFTTEWWLGEERSRVHHTEMVWGWSNQDNEWKVVTMEPPTYRITHMAERVIVFRLCNKPPDFDLLFLAFVANNNKKTKYDFLKFLSMFFDWLFRTRWFSKRINWGGRDICSESVAEFYEEDVRIPCSSVSCKSTVPDDTYDYCKERQDIFEIIYDNEIEG